MKLVFRNILCILTLAMFISILLSGCGGLSAIGKSDSNQISTNYALASNGGKIIVSKEDPKHSGSTLNNGVISSDLWDNGEGWECFFKGQLMDSANSGFRNAESRLNNTTMGWVVIEFPEPIIINRTVIYTLNSKKYPAYRYGVRNIYIQFQVKDNDPWFLVERLGKSITDRTDKIYDNKADIIDCKYKARLAKRIRIAIEETNDLKQISGWGGGSYADSMDWYPVRARIIEGTIRLVEIAVYGTKNANIQNKRLSNVEEPEGETNSTTIKGEDGAEMVLIPAGDFQMGSNDYDNEKPIHTVYLDAFYIDQYEVTNAQYKKFMDAKGYKAPSYWNDSKYNAPNQPVVGVDWNDANAYADWAGERLPTEAEWEKSARGGLVGKKYPWGDTLTHDDENYGGTGGKDIWNGESPVGSFKPNGYGLYDMAGNVWEWCADWHDSNYYATSIKSNPTGPSSGSVRVLRGGSCDTSDDNCLRVAYRNGYDPTHVYSFIGFRCVEEPEGEINSTNIKGKDGVPMVLIPVGEFQMGSNDGRDNEKPIHTVYLDAFYIDKYEVTNAQYKKFVQATGYKEPEGYISINEVGFGKLWSNSNFNSDDQPVVCVSWNDAKAYADWAGKRLPTEAEWEKSARGGLVGKKYPLEDSLTHDEANYDGTSGKDIWNYTSPVGSFTPNGYGLYDMAGNVWEWCADWYNESYYTKSPKSNPTGPSSGTHKVLRGGSWGWGYDNDLRVAYRSIFRKPTFLNDTIGFRCVEEPEGKTINKGVSQ